VRSEDRQRQKQIERWVEICGSGDGLQSQRDHKVSFQDCIFIQIVENSGFFQDSCVVQDSSVVEDFQNSRFVEILSEVERNDVGRCKVKEAEEMTPAPLLNSVSLLYKLKK